MNQYAGSLPVWWGRTDTLVAVHASAARPWEALAYAERAKARVLLDVLSADQHLPHASTRRGARTTRSVRRCSHRIQIEYVDGAAGDGFTAAGRGQRRAHGPRDAGAQDAASTDARYG